MKWTPQTTTLSDYACLLAQQENLCDLRDTLDHSHEGGNPVEQANSGNQAEQANNGNQAEQASSGNPAEQISLASPALSIPITHLAYDSRAVTPGTLFFCKGAHFEPEYLARAVSAGAVAYVSEQDYTEHLTRAGLEPVPALLVREVRAAVADCAALFYQGLLEHLTIVGFTGTKGKSTTTYLLRGILDSWLAQQGKPTSAWLSSIENYDGAACTRSLLTTEDVLELYEHFVHAVESGIEYLTMEVSSQALKYHRTRGIPFEVAGFLNIGEDHISDIEHPDHEDYFLSKLKIFAQSKSVVINRESDESARVLKAAESNKRLLTYGHTQAADVMVSEIQSTAQGLSFVVDYRTGDGGEPQLSEVRERERFTLPMAGQFNVDNALAALTTALVLGIPVEHMKKGLAHAEVSGRMQLVAGPSDKLIVIDYAHNKMSFETIFSTIAREYPARPLACVFGATGCKGLERRIDLPTVAVQYADLIYLTEDDPLEEPLEQINQQIAQVVEAAGKTPVIIEDRTAAIARAINDSPTGSVILVLGKGHETVMKRGRESVPVPSDRERVETILSGIHTKGKEQ